MSGETARRALTTDLAARGPRCAPRTSLIHISTPYDDDPEGVPPHLSLPHRAGKALHLPIKEDDEWVQAFITVLTICEENERLPTCSHGQTE